MCTSLTQDRYILDDETPNFCQISAVLSPVGFVVFFGPLIR